jgi:hypothetical protein
MKGPSPPTFLGMKGAEGAWMKGRVAHQGMKGAEGAG